MISNTDVADSNTRRTLFETKPKSILLPIHKLMFLRRTEHGMSNIVICFNFSVIVYFIKAINGFTMVFSSDINNQELGFNIEANITLAGG